MKFSGNVILVTTRSVATSAPNHVFILQKPPECLLLFHFFFCRPLSYNLFPSSDVRGGDKGRFHWESLWFWRCSFDVIDKPLGQIFPSPLAEHWRPVWHTVASPDTCNITKKENTPKKTKKKKPRWAAANWDANLHANFTCLEYNTYTFLP